MLFFCVKVKIRFKIFGLKPSCLFRVETLGNNFGRPYGTEC